MGFVARLAFQAQAGFGILQCSDVGDMSDEADHLAMGKIREVADEGMADAAVGFDGTAFEPACLAGQGGQDMRLVKDIVRFAQHRLDTVADDGFRRLAEPGEIGGVGEPAEQVTVPVSHQAGHGIDQKEGEVTALHSNLL
jgi:hypothetical protein